MQPGCEGLSPTSLLRPSRGASTSVVVRRRARNSPNRNVPATRGRDYRRASPGETTPVLGEMDSSRINTGESAQVLACRPEVNCRCAEKAVATIECCHRWICWLAGRLARIRAIWNSYVVTHGSPKCAQEDSNRQSSRTTRQPASRAVLRLTEGRGDFRYCLSLDRALLTLAW
jgi:hypothetical protein